MSLSDCKKCWNDPCTCGYDYRDYNKEYFIAMRNMFQSLIDETNIYSSPEISEQDSFIPNGNTYYVNAEIGNNDNTNGKNAKKPFKTLKKALDNTVNNQNDIIVLFGK